MNVLDDDRPKKPVTAQPGERLDTLSVEELRERIGIYHAEIARLERDIQSKEKSRKAADALFRSG